jgi:hypothetical protein
MHIADKLSQRIVTQVTTLRNYRRGWRLTLLALAASAVGAGLFVLHAFGITVL